MGVGGDVPQDGVEVSETLVWTCVIPGEPIAKGRPRATGMEMP